MDVLLYDSETEGTAQKVCESDTFKIHINAQKNKLRGLLKLPGKRLSSVPINGQRRPV
jgi:hypothetical protein